LWSVHKINKWKAGSEIGQRRRFWTMMSTLDSERQDYGLWTRWRLWTSKVLIFVNIAGNKLWVAVQQIDEVNELRILKELRNDLIKLQFNYIHEVNVQQRDVGRKSKAINAQEFPYVH
jgi:hypothetical protein